MNTAVQYLFVYGTLLKDSRHEIADFLYAHTENLGKGYFQGKLFEVSSFPGAIVSECASDSVYGSLFKVNDFEIVFKTLDEYEGVGENKPQPNLFKRQVVKAYLEDGSIKEAWVYLYNYPIDNLKRIVSGDFTNR